MTGTNENMSIMVHRAVYGSYEDLEGELPITRSEIEVLPDGEERYKRLARVVKEHSMAVFAYDNKDGALIMDVVSANVVVQVADALKPENRAKLLGMDIGIMVDTAWKVVGYKREA